MPRKSTAAEMLDEQIHWTQTREGRERMRRIAKARYRKAKKMSRGEQAVVQSLSPDPGLLRMQSYVDVVRVAHENNELPKLVAEIREQALSNLRQVLS